MYVGGVLSVAVLGAAAWPVVVMVVVFVVIKIFGGPVEARGTGVCSALPISVNRVLGVSNKLPRYHHHAPRPAPPRRPVSRPHHPPRSSSGSPPSPSYHFFATSAGAAAAFVYT